MKKQQLMDIMTSLGMRPGRGLGQNFLLDGNLLDYIVRTSGAAPGMTVLEVGPGFGALTRGLLEAGAEVYAIEFDRRLIHYLKKEFTMPEFHLIEGDACKVDFASQLPQDRPFRCIANLPYAISSVFIARLLTLDNPPTNWFFMLQKEMAQRLAADVKTKNYGALSVRAQLMYKLELVRVVPPEVFYPPPAVESALLAAQLLENVPPECERKKVDSIARMAFHQRRKKLTNTLGAAFGNDCVAEALYQLKLSADARPENLTCQDFLNLSRLLPELAN
ncbi:MAG: 16S rRNA (adenine(1518)-N(6)/adenine(1519)-N(6))-dimethyltransferase RsmA [Victivallaceae bacterium]